MNESTHGVLVWMAVGHIEQRLDYTNWNLADKDRSCSTSQFFTDYALTVLGTN